MSAKTKQNKIKIKKLIVSNELTKDELNMLANLPSAISSEEMMQMEEAANDKARGKQRRLCLLACARSTDVLSKLSVEAPDAFAEMMESIEAFKTHAKGLVEVAEAAYIRMLISGGCAKHQA
jgi:hypothetical protein